MNCIPPAQIVTYLEVRAKNDKIQIKYYKYGIQSVQRVLVIAVTCYVQTLLILNTYIVHIQSMVFSQYVDLYSIVLKFPSCISFLKEITTQLITRTCCQAKQISIVAIQCGEVYKGSYQKLEVEIYLLHDLAHYSPPNIPNKKTNELYRWLNVYATSY